MTAIFDTLAFTKKLTTAGFTPDQAEQLAEALHGIAFTELATKADLREAVAELRHEIKDSAGELRQTVNELQIRLGLLMGGLVTLSTAIIAVVVSR